MIFRALSQLGSQLSQAVTLNKEDAELSDRVLFRKCPLCDSESLINIAQGDCSKHPLYQSSLSPIINWKQCADCMHIFTEGYYTDNNCKIIYSKTNSEQQVGADLEKQRVVSSRIVEKILPYVSKGCWMDVGFGNGSLLFTAQEYGFIPVGLDVRSDTVKTMLSFGIESYCADILQFSHKSEFAVISMADVLEHMPYPRDVLQVVYKLLSKDGVLFISMPNIESMVWKALDSNNVNPYWGELEHYHNFSRAILYRLLRKYGFEPLLYGISERYRASMEVIAKKL